MRSGDGGDTRRSAAGQAMVELQANAPAAGEAMVVGLSPLSETLWRDNKALPGAGASALIGDVSARLTWKDLSVTVALGPGKTQTVLDELTGYAEPGSLTALMGPSGSGKSTLLDALAGRLAANAFQTGSVLLNGRKAKLSFGAAVCFALLLCTIFLLLH
jgi:ABC-type transport system involved in cytochrome bd biosynthesis fused ATPase/permease subunit